MKQQEYQTLGPAERLEKLQNSKQVFLGAAHLEGATPARLWLVRQHVPALHSIPGNILMICQQPKESVLTCILLGKLRGEAG